MKHLNEQIKQAKIKKLHKQHNEKQSFQQNNTQPQLNTLQHVQSPLNNPTRRFINSGQQRTQQILISPRKPSMAMSVPSSGEHNIRVSNVNVEISPLEHVQDQRHVTQQSPSPQLDDSSSSESIAYLQRIINDPSNAIVQHQIQGNTAKMLVMLATGEQRLITFDIPKEDCTVRDLLDVHEILGKVNITISGETQVSLVDDPTLGINYIVDARGSTVCTTSLDDSDGDCNSFQEVVSTATENLFQNTNQSSCPWSIISDKMSNEKSWSFEKDEMLIELVKANPGLYNLQSPFYNDNNYKRKCWDKIAKTLNQPEFDVEIRWKFLRAEYQSHLSKQRMENGQAATKMTKWIYHDQMSFLHKFVNQDRQLTSIDEISVKEEEEDSCMEIHEKDFQEDAETITVIQNNDEDLTQNNDKSQTNSKTVLTDKKKPKWHSIIQESDNQDRPRLTSIDEISIKEEEEDFCMQIHEKDFQEDAETTTVIQNNDVDLSQNNDESQANSKTVLINKKKPKLHSVIQENGSMTLMKYLTEKKQKEESKVSHSMDNFFSLMAATVENFSPIDQHYVKTKVFAIVNDLERKYLMESFANSSSQQSPVNVTSSPQQSSVNTTSLQ